MIYFVIEIIRVVLLQLELTKKTERFIRYRSSTESEQVWFIFHRLSVIVQGLRPNGYEISDDPNLS